MFNSRKFDKEKFKKSIEENVKVLFRKTVKEADTQQLFQAVCISVKDTIVENWMDTQKAYEEQDPKIVYYMSMEFLMGRALGNNLINLCEYKEVKEALEEMGIDYDCRALSAHRTPELVMEFASQAKSQGTKVIIAGAGGAAHLPGVIAAYTAIPVIGVPIKSSNSIDGWDSILSILQMPSGIPVATVALNGAKNAAILATEMIATGDDNLYKKLEIFKESLKQKVIAANKKLQGK